MRTNDCIRCPAFPCTDVIHNYYIVPGVDLIPERIKIILISESSPHNLDDYYLQMGNRYSLAQQCRLSTMLGRRLTQSRKSSTWAST